MKVIFVDDEPIIQRSFLRQCRDIAWIELVKTFQTAEEVLSFSEKDSFDIIFIDIGLPKMNGIELAKRLKKEVPDLLIILASAWEPGQQPYEKTVCDGYITKPFSAECIEKAIWKAVGV